MRLLSNTEIENVSGAGTIAAILLAPVAVTAAIGGTLMASLSCPILLYQGKGLSGCAIHLGLGLGIGVLIEQSALQW